MSHDNTETPSATSGSELPSLTGSRYYECHGQKYVSRPCDSITFRCDRCDLQAQCPTLFKNGEDCKIISFNMVWMKLPSENTK